MAYTTMKSWGSEVLTSSDMNTYLRDNIEYLYGQVTGLTFSGVMLSRGTAALTVATSTDTNITWTTEETDVGAWWSSGTVITVPSAAVPSGSTAIALIVLGSFRYTANGTGGRGVWLNQNGTTVDSVFSSAVTGETTTCTLATIILAEAADDLAFVTRQTSGGNLDMDTAKVRIARLGPVS